MLDYSAENDGFAGCPKCGCLQFGLQKVGNKVEVMCASCNHVACDAVLTPSEDRLNLKELPGEDMELLRRLEAQFDGDTDPEGGDLYSDRDNDFIECPSCGSLECDDPNCDGVPKCECGHPVNPGETFCSTACERKVRGE